MITFSNQQQFNNFKNSRYREIYNHELAHKNTAGALAGPIVIEKDSNGIAFAGHVSIKMPKLNEQNPDETITQAKTVINSALAPSDPSEQDYKVANSARQVLNKAESLKRDSAKSGSKIDYNA